MAGDGDDISTSRARARFDIKRLVCTIRQASDYPADDGNRNHSMTDNMLWWNHLIWSCFYSKGMEIKLDSEKAEAEIIS